MKTLVLHPYHDTLIGWVDIKKRVETIRNHKPKHERNLRLKWMKKVKGKLPEKFVITAKAYCKAVEAYRKAGEAYRKAEEAYCKAEKKHMPAIVKLHKKECPDCTWNGKELIFPE